jgi:hypothetical protein
MTTTTLTIDSDNAAPRKKNATGKRHCFACTVDDTTFQSLTTLQRVFTSRTMIPSRTLLVRLALRHLETELTMNAGRGDKQWMADRVDELRYMAHAGKKP